jgi:hypothetical protein
MMIIKKCLCLDLIYNKIITDGMSSVFNINQGIRV